MATHIISPAGRDLIEHGQPLYVYDTGALAGGAFRTILAARTGYSILVLFFTVDPEGTATSITVGDGTDTLLRADATTAARPWTWTSSVGVMLTGPSRGLRIAPSAAATLNVTLVAVYVPN